MNYFDQHEDQIYAAGLRGVVPMFWGLALDRADGVVHVLRCLLAEADFLMAIDGHPTVANLRSADLMTN